MKTTTVKRQSNNGAKSKQPRFSEKQFSRFLRWLTTGLTKEPAYQADSRERDRWLMDFWRKETLLAGVLNSVVLIDANRGWSITGGRNQVKRYTAVMHNAENGAGWRYFAKRASLSFWATDMCCVTEVGRDGEGGPLRAIYNVDSTRCKLTGDPEYPLDYRPVNGKLQHWKPEDFFRTVSMPQTDESLFGLGFCAVSRALEFAKLMYAVYQHDQEKLDARIMKGILFLQGVTEDQWQTAMESREDKLTAKEREYYAGIEILTSFSNEFPIDGKLLALSQLPDGFDQEVMTNVLMYGYALCFGYDPREFWPVSMGSLGTGRETQVQAEKATSKGGGDWRLSFQESLQKNLPETLHFEFDERDDQGELLQAQVRKAKADVTNSMAEVRRDLSALSSDEIRQLWAADGLIPEEWTEVEEVTTATDESEEQLRQRMLENPIVRDACQRYENEPIIRYTYAPIVDAFGELVAIREKEKVLWSSGGDALRPKVWYNGDGWKLTQKDIERACR